MRVDCTPSNSGGRGLQDISSQAIPQVFLSNLYVQLRPVLDANPQFSWTFSSTNHLITQISYQVLLSKHRTSSGYVWSSGVIKSSNSRSATYTGPLLASHTRYFWSIRVETTAGPITEWSHFKSGHMMSPVLGIQKRDAHDPLADTFRLASWIWTLEANSPQAPAGDRAFRRTYRPPGTSPSVFADVIMTVDNQFSLFVNGIYVGGAQDEFSWPVAQRFNVSLNPGTTVFAVRGTNVLDSETGRDTIAGVLAAIEITHSDGSTAILTSDNNWLANKVIPTDFEQPHTDDSAWPEAHVIAQFGTPLWPVPVTVPALFTAVNVPSSISTTPPTSATSSAPSSTPLQSSSTNLTGPIVGGVLGGVVVLGLLITLLWFRKRGFKLKLGSAVFFFDWVKMLTLEMTGISQPPTQQLQPFNLQNPLVTHTRGKGQPASSTDQGASVTEWRPVSSDRRTRLRQKTGSGSVERRLNSGGSGGSDATRNRLQRLQDLVSGLNREVTDRGEEGPYVSELRGGIAELIREDADLVTLPPPYRGPSELGDTNV
ncbi:hypothetical protein DXG01_008672 [Tephrocybe rancida]|nr:hypothetical protein DXG01_008672 [Tephrocybe rancida]